MKKKPKVYHVYRLDFADGSVYFGMTANLKTRERQHLKKWGEPHALISISSHEKKAVALATEQWLVLDMFFRKPRLLRNRFCNRFSLPGVK